MNTLPCSARHPLSPCSMTQCRMFTYLRRRSQARQVAQRASPTCVQHDLGRSWQGQAAQASAAEAAAVEELRREVRDFKCRVEGQLDSMFGELGIVKNCIMQLYNVLLPGKFPQPAPPQHPATAAHMHAAQQHAAQVPPRMPHMPQAPPQHPGVYQPVRCLPSEVRVPFTSTALRSIARPQPIPRPCQQRTAIRLF